MIRILVGLAALSLVIAPPLAAQVYQWVDENGVRHFSNSPPPEGTTDVREYNEVKSGAAVETPGEGKQESGSVVEAVGEAAEDAVKESSVKIPDQAAEPSDEGEKESGSALEAADDDETAEVEAVDDGPEATAAGTQGPSDTEEEETPEDPTTDQASEDELIERETDRLEVKMMQLNRRLEEAQTARDRGSSYDVEQWNKKIAQIQSEIEKEKDRTEARIEQIRKKTGLQP